MGRHTVLGLKCFFLKIAKSLNFSKYDELLLTAEVSIGSADGQAILQFLFFGCVSYTYANRIFKNITQLIIYLEISIKTTCFQIPNKIPAAIVMLPANNIHVKYTVCFIT